MERMLIIDSALIQKYLKNKKVTDFKTYYKKSFQSDLHNFLLQVPVEGNKHFNKNEICIQYFFLTPQYIYLDIIPHERRGMFAVALFWTILVDQIFFTYYREFYHCFQSKTLYPKFIGNCTAPSLVTSQCGSHQHPRKVFKAINDTTDKGNKFDIDRIIFKKDENKKERTFINFEPILEFAKHVMKDEIKDYFESQQPEINWLDFWIKCENESY